MCKPDNRLSANYLFAASLLTAAALIFTAATPTPAQAGSYGKFQGEVIAKWDANRPQNMTLIKGFTYIDGQNHVWSVPAGYRTDGASIPPLLYSVVGPPFAGRYRRAAVIHDYYCDLRQHPWQAVHEMFYNALLADGVSYVQANIMWAAVYRGGPRWPDPRICLKKNSQNFCVLWGIKRGAEKPKVSRRQMNKAQFNRLAAWIKKTRPTQAQIKKAIDSGKF